MKTITFRIDKELVSKARDKAKKLGRSLSGQIRYLLQKFIDDE